MTAKKHPEPSDDIRQWPIEWLTIISPAQAEVESSISWDTVKRHHPDWIIDLSPRRRGIRRGHALMLGAKGGQWWIKSARSWHRP